MILHYYMDKEAEEQEDNEENDNAVNNEIDHEDNFADLNHELIYPI